MSWAGSELGSSLHWLKPPQCQSLISPGLLLLISLSSGWLLLVTCSCSIKSNSNLLTLCRLSPSPCCLSRDPPLHTHTILRPAFRSFGPAISSSHLLTNQELKWGARFVQRRPVYMRIHLSGWQPDLGIQNLAFVYIAHTVSQQ